MPYIVTRDNLAGFAQLVAETLVLRVFAGKDRRKITHEQFVVATANVVVQCFVEVEAARAALPRPALAAVGIKCRHCGLPSDRGLSECDACARRQPD